MTNTKNKITLQQFCELINSQDEWKLSNNDIISENGWNDETGTSYGICSDATFSLRFNERGEAEVVKRWGGARKGAGRKSPLKNTKRATFLIEKELLEKIPRNKSRFVNEAINSKLTLSREELVAIREVERNKKN